jgi:hypothetical protein
MTPVPLNTLYDLLLPYLPAVETPLLDSQIVKVARDFFKRTTLLREEFVFNTAVGIAEYQLNPTYGEVSSILEIWPDGGVYPLSAVPEDRRSRRDAGQPQGWFSLLPNLPQIYPTPDGEYTLRVRAVIRPKHDDTTLPGEYVDQYREQLAAGVLAAMFGMPGKPWTQSKAAADAGRMYAGEIKTIRATLRDGGQPNQSTFTAARRFGR